jgi:hypothetical protein
VARRIRTVATMVALVAILVAGAYYGWTGVTEGWLGGDGEATASAPEEPCSTPPPVTLRVREVRVSVYNAGAPGGEATAVMGALGERGFRQGVLTDAPSQVQVDGIAIVPGRNVERGAVRLVLRQFREVRDVRARLDRRPLGPGVNVLVGRDFFDLAPDAPREIKVAQPEVC